MSFALQRERRPNAGNRMRALLDKEIDMEELFEESEDDEEFHSEDEPIEKDVYDSDFDIHSSEGEEEHEALGRQEDMEITRVEKQERRQRQQWKQPSAVSGRPAAKEPKPSRPQPKPRKRKLPADGTRQSLRTNTVLNRIQVEEQLKEDQLKKDLLPKRQRPEIRRATQEEMLAEAALTEEKNKASLEQWLKMEAEKKVRAKKKEKQRIVGPFVRFHSISDGKPEERPKRRKIMLISPSSSEEGNVTEEITDPEAVEWQAILDADQSELVGRNFVTFGDTRQDQESSTANVKTTGLSDRELDRTDLIPALSDWLVRAPRPAKPVLCPVTGLPAQYREPKTMVPYANTEAYKVIQSCLTHAMTWSPSLGIYLGGSRGAAGVPEGWDRFMRGKKPEDPSWAAEDGTIQLPKWLAGEPVEADKSSPSGRKSPAARRTRQRSRPLEP